MTVTFEELGLSQPVCKAIAELGYEEPTPIQAQTIQLLRNGADVIAQAQTGTGKTAAFALPIIDNLETSSRTPQALILTPTRELAVQVAEAIHSYGKYLKISVLPVYGGQPIERQLRALNAGVQIVVGTPGRILDHIRRGTLKLDQVRTLVLDEADEMLDMGFIEDIETILQETPEERQTALFSATLSNPVAKLAQRYMHDPQRITIAVEQMTVSQIRQVYYEVGRRDKTEILVRILDFERPTSSIIFCRTKSEVDRLGERLIARAFSSEGLHGDLSQAQRDRVMARFRAGQVELLVATDVAARGLDIENVSHVINYDIPGDPDSYVHRIGRTGRAGRTGCAITLITPREFRLLQLIQRTTGAVIQRMRLPTIADVLERRRESFKERLRETIAQGGLEPYMLMAETLGEEYSPVDLAAAAFKLLLGEASTETEDKLAEADVADSEVEPKGRKKRRDRGQDRGRFGPEEDMTRLYINIGRDNGLRPGDVVGAIANEANVPGRVIGVIEMFDGFSFVEVPSNLSKQVLSALNHTSIRGWKVSASLTKPEGSEDKKRRKKKKH